MSDVITFLRNYDYDICLAQGNRWTLEEAVDYLAAYQANKQRWHTRQEAYSGFLKIKEQLLTTVQQGIDEMRLVIGEEYTESLSGESGIKIDFRKSIVVPIVFIDWALENNIDVPKQYEKYAAKNKDLKSNYYEALGVKKSTIHHERCRAVAELLWSMHPEIPIAEMARRSEIIQFGCEGQQYDMRTISRWLASLKAVRRPDRRKKSETA